MPACRICGAAAWAMRICSAAARMRPTSHSDLRARSGRSAGMQSRNSTPGSARTYRW